MWTYEKAHIDELPKHMYENIGNVKIEDFKNKNITMKTWG